MQPLQKTAFVKRRPRSALTAPSAARQDWRQRPARSGPGPEYALNPSASCRIGSQNTVHPEIQTIATDDQRRAVARKRQAPMNRREVRDCAADKHQRREQRDVAEEFPVGGIAERRHQPLERPQQSAPTALSGSRGPLKIVGHLFIRCPKTLKER